MTSDSNPGTASNLRPPERGLVLLGYSENRIAVWYDPLHSHAATHLADTPYLKRLAQEVISSTVLRGEPLWFETDMGKSVGTTSLVETDETDEIIYAKRLNRQTYSRFTKSRQPRESRLVTVALNPLDNDDYILTSTWIGEAGYTFPDDPMAVPESRSYWQRHALVWGTQEVQPGSETRICPW
jgi:hypothetical protein